MKVSLILIIIAVHFSCRNEPCQIVELHENNSPKIKICLDGNIPGLSHHEYYFQNGEIESLFSLKNEKLHGVFKEYFQGNKTKIIGNYINGKREGDYIKFNKSGAVTIYNYCQGDKTIYVRAYNYDIDPPIVKEVFKPRISFLRDSFSKKDSLVVFTASLPIPDSLFDVKELSFSYELRKKDKEDRLIDSGFNEPLDNKKELKFQLKAKNLEDQILYCYAINEKKKIIYEPFEKEIIFK